MENKLLYSYVFVCSTVKRDEYFQVMGYDRNDPRSLEMFALNTKKDCITDWRRVRVEIYDDPP